MEPRLKEAALEAIRLDPLLPDAQAALGDPGHAGSSVDEGRGGFPARARRSTRARGCSTSTTRWRCYGRLNVWTTPWTCWPERVTSRRCRSTSCITLAIMQIEAGLYKEAIAGAHWVLNQDPEFPFIDRSSRPRAGSCPGVPMRPSRSSPASRKIPGLSRLPVCHHGPPRRGRGAGSRVSRCGVAPYSGSTAASGTRIAPSRRSTAR